MDKVEDLKRAHDLLSQARASLREHSQSVKAADKTMRRWVKLGLHVLAVTAFGGGIGMTAMFLINEMSFWQVVAFLVTVCGLVLGAEVDDLEDLVTSSLLRRSQKVRAEKAALMEKIERLEVSVDGFAARIAAALPHTPTNERLLMSAMSLDMDAVRRKPLAYVSLLDDLFALTDGRLRAATVKTRTAELRAAGLPELQAVGVN